MNCCQLGVRRETIKTMIGRFKMSSDLWPVVNFDKEIEPHFLFIITPPYSGSTALAEFLNTSNRATFLQKSAEGQWLVPGLCADDRWEKSKVINYHSIKSIWLNKYQSIAKPEENIDVVIEKSPPNMMRIVELSSHFRSSSFIANNRNPYANCASILYRHHDADNISSEKRIEILSILAKNWLKRSVIIDNLVKKLHIPLITYESFCKKPSSVVSVLQTPKGVSNTINVDPIVKVKDYPPQKIINQNDRQIDKLSDSEIVHLTSIFTEYQDLLDRFKYSSM